MCAEEGEIWSLKNAERSIFIANVRHKFICLEQSHLFRSLMISFEKDDVYSKRTVYARILKVS